MTKSKIAFVFLFVGISSAQAMTFHSMDGVDRGCKLAKFTGGKWYQSDEKDVNGQDVTNITPSKANADFSNFKFQNTWYATKSSCLKAGGGGSSDGASASTSISSSKKFFAELKFQKYLILGTIAPTSNNYTTATAVTNYTSGLGFDGRFGYQWKDNRYFFLDVSTLSASQTVTYTLHTTGGFSGNNEPVSDSILLINVGYLMNFPKILFWGTHSYAAGMLGYGKLSGTITNVDTYSGGGIDLGVEGGLVKDLNSSWSVLTTLGLSYLSINPTVSTTSVATTYPIASALGSRSYTHFTLALGARYSF